MFAVLRTPISDFRPFAADADLYRGVRLPSTWSEGEFVRGVGLIYRRGNRSVNYWPSERTYADFRNSARLPPRWIETSNRELERRLWRALPGVDCLFDYDFAVPFRLDDIRLYGNTFNVRLSTLIEVPRLLAESIVTIGKPSVSAESASGIMLLKAGKRLSQHFAVSTATSSARDVSVRFVRAGVPVLTVEATGIESVLDLSGRVDRYQIGDIEVLGFQFSGLSVRAAQ